uniref:GPI-anchored protein LLG1-like domain-containing protein n=1 Tax=Kalanchoe fedtschenkoi TaxID=63787 RepID=A0A7N0UQI7_KALFE
MGLNLRFSLIYSSYVLVCFLFVGSSTATYISDDMSGSHVSVGRSLLQTRKSSECSVNFELLDYSDLINQCKGPSCINLYGKYPPGLFASLCPEGKEGLDCTNFTPTDITSDLNGSPHVVR